MRIVNDRQAQEICEIIVMLTRQFIKNLAQGKVIEDEVAIRRQFKLELLRTYLQEQKRISVDLIHAIEGVIIIDEQLIKIVGAKSPRAVSN